MQSTIPAGYVDAIWRAVKAQVISWADANELQQAAYPRCLAHDRPAVGLLADGTPQCDQCVADAYQKELPQ